MFRDSNFLLECKTHRTMDDRIPILLRNTQGVTLLGLIISVIGLTTIVILIFSLLFKGSDAAYEITVKHDLKAFIDAQKTYFSKTHKYYGKKGDIFCDSSGFKWQDFGPSGFTLSEDVMITVYSESPFIVIAQHAKGKSRFEYNFNSGIIAEKGELNEK